MPTKYHAQVMMTPNTKTTDLSEDTASVAHGMKSDHLATAPRPIKRALRPVSADYIESPSARDSDTHDERRPGAEGLVYRVLKRTFDLVLGSIMLCVAVPFILTAALAIRVDTPGSPFFFQTRLGKHGKPFKIFKLRGMYRDAPTRFPSYYDYSKKCDLEFCFHHEDDPRVTRAGRFIRKTSIDELPNLWNVVLGDMSLVGPRPEIPDVLALYGAYREEYLSVKPGITCLSKCSGRDRLTKRETIELDIRYIRSRSLAKEFVILWRTLRGVLLRRDVF